MSLYASGRTTGLVIGLGDGVSECVPFYEGYMLPRDVYVKRSSISGEQITEYFVQASLDNDNFGSPEAKKEIARDIKEKLGYIASDYDDELQKAYTASDIQKNYELPDGQVITLGSERFKGPEALFQPRVIGGRGKGIHALAYESIMKCDIDIRKDLWNNIILHGGTSMFDGIQERVSKELKVLAPDKVSIKVIAAPERKYMAWIGGSILSSLSTFEEMWILKEEYDQAGPSIVHRKCLVETAIEEDASQMICHETKEDNDNGQEISQLKSRNQVLQKENDSLKSDIANKTAMINSLQDEVVRLKQQNLKLNDDQKEMQMELNDIKNKYNKLLSKEKLNENKYLEWDSEHVADWILSLDDEYGVYEEVLRRNLKNESVDGTLLGDLERNDLHRFGINNLKHKIAIMKHMKRLSSQQSNAAAPAAYANDGPGSTAYI